MSGTARRIHRRMAVPCVIVLTYLCSLESAEASPLTDVTSSDGSDSNERTVLRYVLPVLKAGSKSVRIYYRADCSADNNNSIMFPKVDAQPPSRSNDEVTAVRSIFRNAKDVNVTDDREGIIRVRIGVIPDTLLRTRISIITLSPVSQYNSMLALNAIEATPEVQLAMGKLNIHALPRVFNMLAVQPAEGLPHLPSEIADVSLDQALDAVALTFRGTVLYGVCQRQHRYVIDFAGGIYFDYSSL